MPESENKKEKKKKQVRGHYGSYWMVDGLSEYRIWGGGKNIFEEEGKMFFATQSWKRTGIKTTVFKGQRKTEF